MTNLLEGLKSRKGGNGKTRWSLNEALYVLNLISENEGISAKEIADILPGRTVHAVRYKFFEGVDANGKCRSFQKFNSVEEIYQYFKVEVPEDLETDVAERIEQFESTLGDAEQVA